MAKDREYATKFCRIINSAGSVLGALVVLAIGVFGQTRGADALPIVAPAYGSAVFGQIDATGCQSPAGSFNFLNGGNCFSSLSQSPGIAASGLLNDPVTGSFAAASANLGSGAVSVSVAGVTGPTPGSAGAHALIWDTLTFSGAAPGATVTITMSGTASLGGDARIAAGAVLLPGGIVSPYALLEGNDYFFLEGAGASPADAVPTYSFQETFGITNGVPMFFGYYVEAFAGVSGCDITCPPPGAASITDPISFDLPTGVTFTSAVQESLTSVPEPATWTMFLLGFGGIGFMLRKARCRTVRATA